MIPSKIFGKVQYSATPAITTAMRRGYVMTVVNADETRLGRPSLAKSDPSWCSIGSTILSLC